MKAVIPVAGIGSRLRPHTHTQPKALVPVAGKPILSHIVDPLIEVGIKDFLFIVGYMGNKVEEFISSYYAESNVKVDFILQEPREGTAHALWLAKEKFRNEKEVLIALGDTIIDIDLEKLLSSEFSVLGVKKVDIPGNFGIAEINKEGFIERLVEKPKIPKSNMALIGIYKISNPEELAQAVEHIVEAQIKTLGEYQLTDALMHMINNGEKMTTLSVDNWFDCGRKESLLEANAILMSRPEFKSSELDLHKTILVPPVSIGKNCKISNSIIGPNVAIGDNTKISYSIIKNTIVGSFSELQSAVLHNSIIGSDTTMKGLSHSLNIGDNTEINFTS
ncbi:sugar phosphate nucleotidyltransferase [Fulvivirgaceae bacterium BMA10]|uniref:Sugar phosphate nucleotidyltransferase n=1 Tax=Splendidivirga corallicola TaxID=3051826 RepID=A0ABT8KLJ0_9BACT|nr:sugar phosphate nucleotidyltransferase [Fulvivirgaceae bacterium BMA10]